MYCVMQTSVPSLYNVYRYYDEVSGMFFIDILFSIVLSLYQGPRHLLVACSRPSLQSPAVEGTAGHS